MRKWSQVYTCPRDQHGRPQRQAAKLSELTVNLRLSEWRYSLSTRPRRRLQSKFSRLSATLVHNEIGTVPEFTKLSPRYCQ